MPDQQEKKQADQKQPVKNIMPSKYVTPYDQNRDPYYGVEYDPYAKKSHDAR